MRSVWITSTSINNKYIRVFDAVVNFFPGNYCNCVYVYLYIVAVGVYSVYVCIVCGCSGTGFLFALTAFYIHPTDYHIASNLSTKITKTSYFIHRSFNGNDITAATGTLPFQ